MKRGSARGNLKSDIAKCAPVMRLENFRRHGVRVTRRLPDVAPTGDFPAPIEGPTAALVREVRGEVRQRLSTAEEFRAGRIPRQAQRLRVGQAYDAPAASRHVESRKRRR